MKTSELVKNFIGEIEGILPAINGPVHPVKQLQAIDQVKHNLTRLQETFDSMTKIARQKDARILLLEKQAQELIARDAIRSQKYSKMETVLNSTCQELQQTANVIQKLTGDHEYL